MVKQRRRPPVSMGSSELGRTVEFELFFLRTVHCPQISSLCVCARVPLVYQPSVHCVYPPILYVCFVIGGRLISGQPKEAATGIYGFIG